MKDTLIYPKSSLNLGGILTPLDVPLVMGVINTTPDSFYENSRLPVVDAVLARVEEMLNQGVDIVDIGGYSSRPGAVEVSEQEENERVIPIIKALIKKFPGLIISVDTFRSKIADEALDSGAKVINDISAGNLDNEIFGVIAKHQATYCMMHMRGTPQSMMENIQYDSLMTEMVNYFAQKIERLNDMGVTNLIIDPGFGFSKTTAQNFLVLNNLNRLKLFNLPILVGLSRKSMIYKTLNSSADDSLNGTTVLNTIALKNGASILRVHDVKEAKEAITLLEALKDSN